MLKLYGHYGSQPTRSVAWLLKMKKTPFEFITVNPTVGETRTAEYRQKFPLGLIPALEDATASPPFRLSEAAAIMTYLCEKNGWDDFYPTATNASSMERRARIHEYFSHHNESTRMMTRKVIFPTMKWMFADGRERGVGSDVSSSGLMHNSQNVDGVKPIIRDIAKRVQHKFLMDAVDGSSGYVVDGTPSIADLLAYPDLAQIPMIMDIDYSEWPELEPLRLWMGRMSELPCHDDVHRTVYKIGRMYKSKL